MKYHIKNKISKRELRKHRKQPLPLELMKNDKDYRVGLGQRRVDEIERDYKDFRATENDC